MRIKLRLRLSAAAPAAQSPPAKPAGNGRVVWVDPRAQQREMVADANRLIREATAAHERYGTAETQDQLRQALAARKAIATMGPGAHLARQE